MTARELNEVCSGDGGIVLRRSRARASYGREPSHEGRQGQDGTHGRGRGCRSGWTVRLPVGSHDGPAPRPLYRYLGKKAVHIAICTYIKPSTQGLASCTHQPTTRCTNPQFAYRCWMDGMDHKNGTGVDCCIWNRLGSICISILLPLMRTDIADKQRGVE